MNKIVILNILLFLVLLLTGSPFEVLALTYIVIFHELGHAFVATVKGIFLGFKVIDGNPAVSLSKHDKLTLSSGLIINLLTINLIVPLFNEVDKYPLYTIFIYLLMCIGISLADLYSIFYKPITMEIEE